MFGKLLEDILNLLKLIETAQFGNISNNKMMVRAKIRSDQISAAKRRGQDWKKSVQLGTSCSMLLDFNNYEIKTKKPGLHGLYFILDLVKLLLHFTHSCK